MSKKTIGILVGSLRKESFSKMVAQYMFDLLIEQFNVKFIDISSLEMYNQDLDNEEQTPAGWHTFRQEVKAADAVLFVTPEYNRSIPPVIKNALDIGSRPHSANAWDGKPGAIIGVSPGKIGGFGSSQHLRQVVSFLNVHLLQKPEAYIGGVADLVNENGLADSDTQAFLKRYSESFAAWINRLIEGN